MEQVLIRWAAQGFALLARRLPLRWVRALGNLGGWVLFRLSRGRQRLADRNLRICFGERFSAKERARIRLLSAQNLAKTMLELFRMPAMSEQEWARLVTFSSPDELESLLEEGGGAVCVTAHFGNWELVAGAVARLRGGCHVIARDANDPATARLINQARSSQGVRVLAREQIREMLRALKSGQPLGILPDQHAQSGGIWLDFLGRPASTFTGPATLARRTGVRIVPVFGRRLPDDRIEVYLRPPMAVPNTDDRDADVRTGTQMVNDVLAEEIRRYPEQWLWMHNRWRTPPEEVAG